MVRGSDVIGLHIPAKVIKLVVVAPVALCRTPARVRCRSLRWSVQCQDFPAFPRRCGGEEVWRRLCCTLATYISRQNLTAHVFLRSDPIPSGPGREYLSTFRASKAPEQIPNQAVKYNILHRVRNLRHSRVLSACLWSCMLPRPCCSAQEHDCTEVASVAAHGRPLVVWISLLHGGTQSRDGFVGRLVGVRAVHVVIRDFSMKPPTLIRVTIRSV